MPRRCGDPPRAHGEGATLIDAAGAPMTQAGAGCSTAQNAQRVAASGIEDRHSGQSFVGRAGSRAEPNLAINVFTGWTTKKYRTMAMIRKVMAALMTEPQRKT